MTRTDGKPSMAERARVVLLKEMRRWWSEEKDLIEERGFANDPVSLFALFASYIRIRVTQASPDLETRDSAADSVMRRILPEFPQFLAVWDAFVEEALWGAENPPLETPDVRKGFVKGTAGEGE